MSPDAHSTVFWRILVLTSLIIAWAFLMWHHTCWSPDITQVYIGQNMFHIPFIYSNVFPSSDSNGYIVSTISSVPMPISYQRYFIVTAQVLCFTSRVLLLLYDLQRLNVVDTRKCVSIATMTLRLFQYIVQKTCRSLGHLFSTSFIEQGSKRFFQASRITRKVRDLSFFLYDICSQDMQQWWSRSLARRPRKGRCRSAGRSLCHLYIDVRRMQGNASR